jgi:hypothetical protein
MAIFSVSDIIITATLVVNALALISSKLPRLHHLQIPSGGHDDEKKLYNNFPFGTSLAEQLMSLSQSDQQKDSVHNDVESGGTESLSDYSGASVMVRVRMLVFGIRKFSCVIVIWNFLFFILMVFVFGS